MRIPQVQPWLRRLGRDPRDLGMSVGPTNTKELPHGSIGVAQRLSTARMYLANNVGRQANEIAHRDDAKMSDNALEARWMRKDSDRRFEQLARQHRR